MAVQRRWLRQFIVNDNPNTIPLSHFNGRTRHRTVVAPYVHFVAREKLTAYTLSDQFELLGSILHHEGELLEVRGNKRSWTVFGLAKARHKLAEVVVAVRIIAAARLIT